MPLTAEQERIVRKKYALAFEARMREFPDNILDLKVQRQHNVDFVHIRKDPGWLNPGVGGAKNRFDYYNNHNMIQCIKSVAGEVERGKIK